MDNEIKCRNIYCDNRSLKHKENCKVIVPVRGARYNEKMLNCKSRRSH